MSVSPSVLIRSLGVHTPARRVTNEELSRTVETSDEWIRTRSGIAERRIAGPGENPSDMGAKAAAQALERAGLKPGDIDLLIVATMTPDLTFPSTACLLQAKLGLRTDMLRGGHYRRALVIGAEKLSSVVDWKDRSTCVLFGDAAGAAVIETSDQPGTGVLANLLGADGTNAELLYAAAGGSAKPATAETVAAGEHYLRMNGKEVFKLAVRVMASSCERVLADAGVSSDQIACFIPHQANVRIIEAVADQLGVGMDRFPLNLECYGNTSAASIPLALEQAWREGRIKHNDLVLMVAFGAGLTWGATLIRWHEPIR